jgi:hypothetical protein
MSSEAHCCLAGVDVTRLCSGWCLNLADRCLLLGPDASRPYRKCIDNAEVDKRKTTGVKTKLDRFTAHQ